MDRAFELAREALSVGEVPVGCVLYLPGKSHLKLFFKEVIPLFS